MKIVIADFSTKLGAEGLKTTLGTRVHLKLIMIMAVE
jgi:hypothetical protein